MLINKALLDDLSAKAKESPRLRMNFDLRNTPEDLSQRQLNALEPGTMIPIHRHNRTSETIVVLRGKLLWKHYNDNGEITNSFFSSGWRRYLWYNITQRTMAFFGLFRERNCDFGVQRWPMGSSR